MALKILVVHNRYLIRGGEDVGFETDARLLRERGHTVDEYVADNRRVAELGRLRSGFRTIWSPESYGTIRRRLREGRYDCVHVHNFFPLISPAVYHAARAEGVPVVQTLHNFRLLCPGATFFREGRICEECLGKAVPWPGVVHRCYRGSRFGTAAVAGMLSTHRALGTWRAAVDAYIVFTEFHRRKFIEGGLPADRIFVRPNMVHPDPGVGRHTGDYALYVGRLSEEKGIEVLCEAWRLIGGEIPLKIVGDGPLSDRVVELAEDLPGVTYLGRQSQDAVLELMREARCLVFPSVWYEGMPLTILEAYAVGLPVIAPDLGVMSTLVEDGRTGLHFEPSSASSLAERIREVWTDRELAARLSSGARQAFERNHTSERNYEALMSIYEEASRRAGRG